MSTFKDNHDAFNHVAEEAARAMTAIHNGDVDVATDILDDLVANIRSFALTQAPLEYKASVVPQRTLDYG